MGVGGGVVADSEPEAELAECYAKANPVLTAIGARPLDHERPVAWQPTAGRRLPLDPVAARPDPMRGVFTTVLVRDGVPVLAREHAARLQQSAAAVLGRELDPDALLGRLGDAAATAAAGRSRLRLTVTGDGRVDSEIRPLSISAAGSWELVPVSFPGGLGAHKWADRDPLVRLPEHPASDRADLLLLDADGTLLETGRANLFLVLDDGVHTPRADGRILPGIARASLLRLLGRRGIPVHEHDLGLADLAGAAEVFVTNSVRGVVPVTSCAGVGRWPIGRTTRWLRRTLAHDWQHPGASTAAAAPGTAPKSAQGARVLLIDNYDSFAYNLAQYAQELGADVTVVRNDARTAAQLSSAFARAQFSHLVISPGPGRPEDAGASVELIRRLDGTVPVLGVCLGHQCIGQAYGARVVRAPRPVHGKPAIVHHDGRGVFHGLDGPLVAARYHSLVVDSLPPSLAPTAWTADNTLMGLRHRDHPVEGIQIHPESILTPLGHTLLGNFLERIDATRAERRRTR
jgi:para-aminobenzoate synthetase/4-amino-4-deoxychorismate lyase